ncbi:MAG: hypothetical protein WDN03_13875 [Rhizomicrobium sp.]
MCAAFASISTPPLEIDAEIESPDKDRHDRREQQDPVDGERHMAPSDEVDIGGLGKEAEKRHGDSIRISGGRDQRKAVCQEIAPAPSEASAWMLSARATASAMASVAAAYPLTSPSRRARLGARRLRGSGAGGRPTKIPEPKGCIAERFRRLLEADRRFRAEATDGAI